MNTKLQSGHTIEVGAIVFIRKQNSKRLKQRLLLAIMEDDTLTVCTMSGLTKHTITKSEIHTFINPII